jgi:phosphoribosylformimino-5-aminoimidazole carboxamide ribotide isomerase
MIHETEIRQVSVTEILGLRMAVLRDGTPSQNPRYLEDDDVDSVHLAALQHGAVIATSTWLPRPWLHEPSLPATQLRGMAVAKSLQSSGVGGLLLQAGIDRAVESGSRFVWARARDTAIRFYEKHGFLVVGDQFVDEATGVGHHLVVLDVTQR